MRQVISSNALISPWVLSDRTTGRGTRKNPVSTVLMRAMARPPLLFCLFCDGQVRPLPARGQRRARPVMARCGKRNARRTSWSALRRAHAQKQDLVPCQRRELQSADLVRIDPEDLLDLGRRLDAVRNVHGKNLGIDQPVRFMRGRRGEAAEIGQFLRDKFEAELLRQ